MMKSLGDFNIEDSELLTEKLQRRGIKAESKKPNFDGKTFPIIPDVDSSIFEMKKLYDRKPIGQPGYFKVYVPDEEFLEAESIRKNENILTIQEGLEQIPISQKNLNTLLEIGKAGRLFSALATGGIAKERGEAEMGVAEWWQMIKIIFHPDTLKYFQKNLGRKIWLTSLLGSGILLFVSWLFLGVYKSVSFNFGYLLLGWLELCFVTLAAILKERFGSILGIAFGVIGTLSILIVVFALIFLL